MRLPARARRRGTRRGCVTPHLPRPARTRPRRRTRGPRRLQLRRAQHCGLPASDGFLRASCVGYKFVAIPTWYVGYSYSSAARDKEQPTTTERTLLGLQRAAVASTAVATCCVLGTELNSEDKPRSGNNSLTESACKGKCRPCLSRVPRKCRPKGPHHRDQFHHHIDLRHVDHSPLGHSRVRSRRTEASRQQL